MKRIISLLVALSLLCTITGCSDRNSKSNSNDIENENIGDNIPGTDTDDDNVDFFITDFEGGKDMGSDRPDEPEILKTYAVSTAEYPQQGSKQRNIEGYDPESGRKSILGFNSKVMKQFLEDNDHENRIYSPINIYIALGMLAETSEGNTRQQVLDLLETGSIEELRTLVKGLFHGCESFSGSDSGAYRKP